MCWKYGWKKIRPCGLAKTCFIFPTFITFCYSFRFCSHFMNLVEVHFKSTETLVSFYASAFLLSTARLLLINFFSDIVYRYLGFHAECNLCIVKRIFLVTAFAIYFKLMVDALANGTYICASMSSNGIT